MNHTKGPWLVGESESIPRDNGTFAEAYSITNLEGKNIALVPISGPWIDDVSENEGNSNINLIAAAPELLESLETMVRMFIPTAKMLELSPSLWTKETQKAIDLINRFKKEE